MGDCREFAFGRTAMLAAAVALSAASATAAAQGRDLADLSLEELGNVEVTSVSGRAEPLSGAAASVYVITNDDIRRSGATSLPEALRLAPNLQAARVDSARYAISARGFNGTIANKLLVLIDGRAVYTPLFSGVFWDAQDVMLEDIERIEVISGPGATLWGANAVNGVINVITRSAQATQGPLLGAGGGNLERGGVFRHGGDLGADGHYRVYGKYFDRENTERADGAGIRDGWHRAQVGFRADWGVASSGFTLQGDAYAGKLDQLQPGKAGIDGANLLGRWNRRLASGSDLRLQAYWDHTERDIPGTFGETLDIFDVEFRHGSAPAAAHRVLWGGGYRLGRDRVRNSSALAFLPADKNFDWANVFVQDQIALSAALELTAGLKLESNDYTGWEHLPSVRLAWKPSADRLLWTSLSRAVRAPSRLDRELFVPGGPPFTTLAGGPDFRAEISTVLEVGFRAQLPGVASYSIAAFYHDHDHLRSLEPAAGGGFALGNLIEGTTKGIEAWGSYQATGTWRLSGGAVLLDQDLKLKAGSLDATGPSALGNDPEYQWVLRSSHNLVPRQELDLTLRYVDELPAPSVPAYLAVDLRYGWRARRDLEVSFTVRNLFDPSHPESGAAPNRSEFARGAFLKLRWTP